jgi:hypothetical protein
VFIEGDNMEYFCTICSKEKRDDPGLLPAIERYLNKRIEYVHNESLNANKAMVIFSGRYGLLSPFELIPWYDQKLTIETFQEIVPTLSNQIQQMRITHIVFYCKPKTDNDWYPYHIALEQSCISQHVLIAYHYLEKY